jgi:dihydroxyacid dehydratase/phosphogluconate dehydratase
VLTRKAFANAIRVNGAIGGSTNAVLHLIAIAGRIGVELTLDDWDAFGRDVPTIVNLMPSGKYLMEDFCYAGGLPAVMEEISDLLDLEALTVTGRSVADNIAGAQNFDPEVILPRDRALVSHGGIAVLRGNLAPLGAILKPSAASPHLLAHSGPAVVFRSIEDYKARVDDPDLVIDQNSVMVLQNCGPKGYPGMAEVGNMALPRKLLQRGVRDMVRISDARMSGTAYGTVVLHAAPEAAVGGPLALVRDGDIIELDVEARRLRLHVSDDELRRRHADWDAAASDHARAATNTFTLSGCFKPIAAPISTSWSAAGARRSLAKAISRPPAALVHGFRALLPSAEHGGCPLSNGIRGNNVERSAPKSRSPVFKGRPIDGLGGQPSPHIRSRFPIALSRSSEASPGFMPLRTCSKSKRSSR